MAIGTFQELHGVVDGERGGHGAAGAIDVKVDLLVAVLILQIEQLLNRDVGQVVGDGRVAARLGGAPQKDNPILQQQVAERHLPLPHVFAEPLYFRLERQALIRAECHAWSVPLKGVPVLAARLARRCEIPGGG